VSRGLVGIQPTTPVAGSGWGPKGPKGDGALSNLRISASTGWRRWGYLIATHRGNNRQDVFLTDVTDEDRRRYQQLLLLALPRCRADLLGWCWMSNHVHLIVVPRQEDSLSRLLRRVHSVYAQDFNRRRSRDGHLWKSRFFSRPLGPNRLESALLYADLNPVRAGMTGEATAWEWSSARAHVSGHEESSLLYADRLAVFASCENWEVRIAATSGECLWRDSSLAG
jgi:putative transposase